MPIPTVANQSPLSGPASVFPFGFTATAGRVLVAFVWTRDGDLGLPIAGWSTLNFGLHGNGHAVPSDGVVALGRTAAGGETQIDLVIPQTLAIVLELAGGTLTGLLTSILATAEGLPVIPVTRLTPAANTDYLALLMLDTGVDAPGDIVPPAGYAELADNGGAAHPRASLNSRAIAAAVAPVPQPVDTDGTGVLTFPGSNLAGTTNQLIVPGVPVTQRVLEVNITVAPSTAGQAVGYDLVTTEQVVGPNPTSPGILDFVFAVAGTSDTMYWWTGAYIPGLTGAGTWRSYDGLATGPSGPHWALLLLVPGLGLAAAGGFTGEPGGGVW